MAWARRPVKHFEELAQSLDMIFRLKKMISKASFSSGGRRPPFRQDSGKLPFGVETILKLFDE